MMMYNIHEDWTLGTKPETKGKANALISQANYHICFQKYPNEYNKHNIRKTLNQNRTYIAISFSFP